MEASQREVEVIRVTAEQDTVWIDDAVPAGAVQGGTWEFISADPTPFSGALAHRSSRTSSVLQHFFHNAQDALLVNTGDTLFAYVYLDPTNPPSEVMLQWYFPGGGWNHRAYWGDNLINWGTDGTESRHFAGPLPATGGWVRLEVPASAVGLENTVVTGMAFTQYGGRVTWDAAGKASFPPPPPPPPPSSTDTIWVEDAVPTGAISDGIWNWVSPNPTPISGTLVHQETAAAGIHQHFFYNADTGLNIDTGDTLFAYVYLDPTDPPNEVMLQWRNGSSWNHRAYWGANLIKWGTDGTDSRRNRGPLPAAGGWVRLEAPASMVGLEGVTVNGMAFTLYDGSASWDAAGKY